MDRYSNYSIAYKGLGTGVHEFEFTAGDAFFALFEGGEITRGDVKVDVKLEKHPSLMLLHFAMDGTVTVPCDRCLEDLTLPVRLDDQLYVKFSEEEIGDDGEVMWINPGDDKIELSQYVYDTICLSLPFQRIHPDNASGLSTCNPDMLARFKTMEEDDEKALSENEDVSELLELKKQLGGK